MPPKVKICCISSHEEAQLAIQYGAHAIGLVGPMPSGPGVIDNELIAEIAVTVLPPTHTFLLTSETTSKNIIAHHKKVNTSTIQIVDALIPESYQMIRKALPSTQLVQVIHVIDERSIDEAILVSTHVDALLLDSGNPNLKVKELGGTGRTHDWKLSRRIIETVSVPVFLAGGLKPENVKEAMEKVGPYGVDLCSGVRTANRLDERKLELFFKAVGY
jgi:phosphoribosylanthranilate isomerase